MAMIDYGEDAADKVVGDGELSKLADLADQLRAADIEVLEREAALKLAQARRDHLSNRVIPDHMKVCGQTDIGLPGGGRLRVKTIVAANIKKENEPGAFSWLRSNGHGALIKRVLAIPFGKGKDNEAGDLKEELRLKGLTVEDKVGVHASTLKSFVTQMLEDGKEFPQDLFGVIQLDKAEIVEPR